MDLAGASILLRVDGDSAKNSSVQEKALNELPFEILIPTRYRRPVIKDLSVLLSIHKVTNGDLLVYFHLDVGRSITTSKLE